MAFLNRQYLTVLACTVLLIAGLQLNGCSNNTKAFAPAPQNPDKGSVVYVYRPSSSSNFMYSPRIAVDDNEKFAIGNGDYRYMYLAEGKHTAVVNPTGQYQTKSPVEMNVEAGKSYYLRVNTRLEFEKEGMNTRLFWLEQVPEKQAQAEIAKTDYSGPVKTDTAKDASSEPVNKEGFSVDKTQDPFAGKYEESR